MNRGIDILVKDSAELVHFGVWVFVCGFVSAQLRKYWYAYIHVAEKGKIKWHFAISILEMGYLVIDLVKYLTRALTQGKDFIIQISVNNVLI